MTQSRHTPDGGWGWFVVAASFLVNVLMDGVRFSFGLLYLEFLNYFQESRGAVGWISGIMFGLLLIAAPMPGGLVNKFRCRLVMPCVGIQMGEHNNGLSAYEIHRHLEHCCAHPTMYATCSFVAPISGGLVNMFGCRPVMMTGSFIVSLGFFLGMFAMNVTYLCVTVGVISGFGFSMMFITFYVALVQYFDRRRSLAIGIAVAGSGLGGFAFNPLTNWLLSRYAWRGTLLILSGLLLNGVVCGAVMRPITEKRHSNQRKRTLSSSSDLLPKQSESLSNDLAANEIKLKRSDSLSKRTKFSTYKKVRLFLSGIFMFSLLKNRKFLLFAVVEVCINISFMVPFIYVPDMCLLNIHDITRSQIVWLANAMSIANAVSRIPIGVLVDTCRRRINTTTIMAVLSGIAGVSCIAMPFCRNYIALMTACVCYSAGMVSAMVLIPIVLSELFGDEMVATSFGICLFFGGISGLIGTPLAGWIVDMTKSYAVSFVIAGVECVLGGVILMILPCVKVKSYKDEIKKHQNNILLE